MFSIQKPSDRSYITCARLLLRSSRKCAKACGSKPRTCMTCKKIKAINIRNKILNSFLIQRKNLSNLMYKSCRKQCFGFCSQMAWSNIYMAFKNVKISQLSFTKTLYCPNATKALPPRRAQGDWIYATLPCNNKDSVVC